MWAIIGDAGLWIATLAGAVSVVACLGARHRCGWLRVARIGAAASLGGFLIAGAGLMTSFWLCNFRNEYVASHTERALSLPLRLAAFWSGQEGSLLLWGIFTAAVAFATAHARRHIVHRGEPLTVGILTLLNLFFGLLLATASNPFVRGAAAPADGTGLNPELQHWAMILHPPVLFAGYAGFAVPFAIAFGSLAGGRTDNEWVGQIRRATMISWMLLGAGIVLGAYWAYVELGWGGYWAWDPVENTALLPLLTSTALIHTIILHQHRGMLKAWTVALAAATYILCIFGTYITRSGVIQSVHSFAASSIGTYFLVLLLVLIPVSIGFIVAKRRLLASDAPLPDDLLGREGTTWLGNILLVVMAATTLVGTIFPLISGLFLAEPVTSSRGFYNRIVAPMGIAVAFLMALAPLLVYGTDAARVLARRLITPGIAAVAAAAGAFAAGLHSPIGLACLATGVLGFAAVATAFTQDVRARMHRMGFGPLEAAARVIDGNHRRYGGLLAHVGALVLVLGIAGSSLLSVQASGRLAPGQSLVLGRYTLRFDGIAAVGGDNYTGAQANLALIDGSGRERALAPQRRFYDKSADTTNEISLSSSWREDVYVAFLAWDGPHAVVRAKINPGASWIWFGAIITVSGGILCLLPRLLPRPNIAVAPVATKAEPIIPLACGAAS